MKAQIAERLQYQGEEVAMCTNRFNDYYPMVGIQPKIRV